MAACSVPKCKCTAFKSQKWDSKKCHLCFHWNEAHQGNTALTASYVAPPPAKVSSAPSTGILSGNAKTMAIWEWTDDATNWTAFLLRDIEKVEEGYQQAADGEGFVEMGQMSWNSPSDATRYRFDYLKMTQTNLSSKKQRGIRRRADVPCCPRKHEMIYNDNYRSVCGECHRTVQQEGYYKCQVNNCFNRCLRCQGMKMLVLPFSSINEWQAAFQSLSQAQLARMTKDVSCSAELRKESMSIVWRSWSDVGRSFESDEGANTTDLTFFAMPPKAHWPSSLSYAQLPATDENFVNFPAIRTPNYFDEVDVLKNTDQLKFTAKNRSGMARVVTLTEFLENIGRYIADLDLTTSWADAIDNTPLQLGSQFSVLPIPSGRAEIGVAAFGQGSPNLHVIIGPSGDIGWAPETADGQRIFFKSADGQTLKSISLVPEKRTKVKKAFFRVEVHQESVAEEKERYVDVKNRLLHLQIEMDGDKIPALANKAVKRDEAKHVQDIGSKTGGGGGANTSAKLEDDRTKEEENSRGREDSRSKEEEDSRGKEEEDSRSKEKDSRSKVEEEEDSRRNSSLAPSLHDADLSIALSDISFSSESTYSSEPGALFQFAKSSESKRDTSKRISIGEEIPSDDRTAQAQEAIYSDLNAEALSDSGSAGEESEGLDNEVLERQESPRIAQQEEEEEEDEDDDDGDKREEEQLQQQPEMKSSSSSSAVVASSSSLGTSEKKKRGILAPFSSLSSSLRGTSPSPKSALSPSKGPGAPLPRNIAPPSRMRSVPLPSTGAPLPSTRAPPPSPGAPPPSPGAPPPSPGAPPPSPGAPPPSPGASLFGSIAAGDPSPSSPPSANPPSNGPRLAVAQKPRIPSKLTELPGISSQRSSSVLKKKVAAKEASKPKQKLEPVDTEIETGLLLAEVQVGATVGPALDKDKVPRADPTGKRVGRKPGVAVRATWMYYGVAGDGGVDSERLRRFIKQMLFERREKMLAHGSLVSGYGSWGGPENAPIKLFGQRLTDACDAIAESMAAGVPFAPPINTTIALPFITAPHGTHKTPNTTVNAPVNAPVNSTVIPPVTGIAATPVLDLKKACQPLHGIVMGVESAVDGALQRAPAPKTPKATKQHTAAVYLYTMASAFYRDLNAALRNPDRDKLKPYYSYLRLLAEAMVVLPAAKSTVLWRGVGLDLEKDHKIGSDVTWWGVSSCTPKLAVANGFLGSSGPRTLFSVHSNTAVPIQELSAFKGEEEFILAPGTRLAVDAVQRESNGLVRVTLKELPPPRHVD